MHNNRFFIGISGPTGREPLLTLREALSNPNTTQTRQIFPSVPQDFSGISPEIQNVDFTSFSLVPSVPIDYPESA